MLNIWRSSSGTSSRLKREGTEVEITSPDTSGRR